MKAVIMAGGRGTRIAALAGDLPKPMLPIDGRPVLERELGSLREQGVTDVLISADNLLVSELEVSLGLIDDFRDGRRRIRHFSASPDGDVLVPEGEILLEGRETQ